MANNPKKPELKSLKLLLWLLLDQQYGLIFKISPPRSLTYLL